MIGAKKENEILNELRRDISLDVGSLTRGKTNYTPNRFRKIQGLQSIVNQLNASQLGCFVRRTKKYTQSFDAIDRSTTNKRVHADIEGHTKDGIAIYVTYLSDERAPKTNKHKFNFLRKMEASAPVVTGVAYDYQDIVDIISGVGRRKRTYVYRGKNGKTEINSSTNDREGT